MNTIDVKQIIETRGLDKKEIASQLFPTNKHPALALNRVIAGDSFLDSMQISKLSLLSGLTIPEIFGVKWDTKAEENVLIFTYGDYRAELNRDTWVTKVFHYDSMFHESIIHSGTIALSKYLYELNLIINQYKNQ